MPYRQTRNYENLQLRRFRGVGRYEIPEIEPEHFGDNCEFISFPDALSASKTAEKGVHFFVDDYRFQRIWTNAERYVPILARFAYVLSPDFSTYTDFPMTVQIYNHYRKHWLGAFLQEQGVRVIPTISWSDEESFAWCFDGEPSGGAVAVSSVGCMNSTKRKRLFMNGYEEMMRRLRPETILFYGSVPRECEGNIIPIRPFTSRFQRSEHADT